ncbi:tripartite motif-containing protein 60-like [Aquarana catesbeiana]|uniref:tripartite motif-containing protein 60-like n=1 Tax=Aquarana catesbeiana TaxID=8400 RepID=UPI003CC9399F
MASANVQEDLTCSICLNIYTDPVTLNCGHNFCRECINIYLDTKERNHEEYSCPQCRKKFLGRPELQKNTNLSNIAEKVKSLADLENRKCFKHNRILELYCTEDSTCICVFCMVEGEHRGHEVERLEMAYEKKKTKLRNDLQILKEEREKTEKRVRDLHQHKATATKHTAELKKKVTALFIEIRKRVDDLEKRVQSELSRQAEQKSISELIQKLERKKEELSRKIERTLKLNTADPINLLQDRESDGHTEEDMELANNETREANEFVLSMMLQLGLSNINKTKDSLFPVLPQGTNITLDIKTAANDVEISDDRKIAKSTDVKQKRRNPGIRLTHYQVLSTCEFSSGQHFWKVKGSTSGIWAIGMCYPSTRKEWGYIGHNSKSWAIEWSNDSYEVKHNGKTKHLYPTITSNRLLVYLDYKAGQLSFYELSDPLRLLHTFTTKFTEPLHAVLQVRKHTDNSHSQITML